MERGDRQRRRRALQRPPRRRRPASRRASATGSRSRSARATPTPGSPPAPTTTASPPRTRPATSARRPQRRPPPRRRHRSSGSSAPGASTRASARRTADQSGSGNGASISGASWTASGRFGNALSFDGVNDLVTIADPNEPRPDDRDDARGVGSADRARQRLAYRTDEGAAGRARLLALRGGRRHDEGAHRRGLHRRLQARRRARSLALNTWTHIATTFDGTALKVFVNGVAGRRSCSSPARSRRRPARSGSAATTSGASGSRATSTRCASTTARAARRRSRPDMNTSISSPDATPPSAPARLTRHGRTRPGRAQLGRATDNVVRRALQRPPLDDGGFTPSAANRIAQPTGTSYTDSGLAAGTYYYKVTAEDSGRQRRAGEQPGDRGFLGATRRRRRSR